MREIVEADREAEEAWLRRSPSRPATSAFQEQCTPGYYNNEGQPSAGGGFIGSPTATARSPSSSCWTDWRSAGDFAGLELRP